MTRHAIIMDTEWAPPPDPPKRRKWWWQRLGDWLAAHGLRGDNQDPPVSS